MLTMTVSCAVWNTCASTEVTNESSCTFESKTNSPEHVTAGPDYVRDIERFQFFNEKYLNCVFDMVGD